MTEWLCSEFRLLANSSWTPADVYSGWASSCSHDLRQLSHLTRRARCLWHASVKAAKEKKKSNWFCFLFLFLLLSSICLAAQHRHNEWESKGSTGGGRPRAHHRLLLHGWLQHHQHGRPGHRREGWSLLQAEGQVHEWAEQNSMWVCLSFLRSGTGTTWELKHQVYFVLFYLIYLCFLVLIIQNYPF